MTPRTLRRVSLHITCLAAASILGAWLAPGGASAQETLQGSPDVRAERQSLLQIEFKQRQMEVRELNERARELRKHKHGKRGTHGEQAAVDIDQLPSGGMVADAARPFGPASALTAPTNQRVNSKASPESTGNYTAGEAEQSLAYLGQNGLCAWNDGRGFWKSPTDVQSYGITTDGGATWTDMGILPKTGTTITYWSSDPVVTVNEKTGEFYYCGLTANSGTNNNGVGVARGHFVGGTFVWDGVAMVASGPSASQGFDKQWVAADSLTGNLYVSYTLFHTSTDIYFSRSTDGGATWSTPFTISGSWEYGYVSGSRAVVGPSGEVYVAYDAIGAVDADSMKVAKSTNFGASFGPAIVAATEYSNYYVGAPGFNRARAITFPSFAVDRSTGPYRGRAYLTYNEGIDFYTDALTSTALANSKNEVENNNYWANATTFTVGNTLRGSLSSSDTADWWKFSAVQGTTYFFYADSVKTTSFCYNMRIYCPNDTLVVARLAMSGDASYSDGTNRHALITWTAPSTGTYYLRMVNVGYNSSGTYGSGGYRIRTTTHTNVGNDHARDTRDVMMTWSNNGQTGWASPKRVNDDGPYFDNWLPEIAVPNDGNVYTMWFDWRDTPAACFGGSNIYVSRSTDGGTTWAPNVAATTVTTANWTQVLSDIAPNQGDYNGLYGGDCLALAWADGRAGVPANGGTPDADVWSARVQTGYQIAGCPGDQVVNVGITTNLSTQLFNPNVLFGNGYNYTLSVDRPWDGYPVTGTVSAAASGLATLPITLAVPDTASDGEVVHVCLTVSQNGANVQGCCFNATVSNVATATLASLSSSSAEPGLVKLSWLVTSQLPVNVYRSTDGVSWSLVAQVTPVQGVVNVADANVTGGATYRYRLGLTVDGREVTAGQTSVSVPIVASFALGRVFPSPAPSGFSVSFSLPTSAPAQLEVIDLAGRRVMSRSVGMMGAGFHTLSLQSETARLPIGIYAVRLSQGSRVATTKVSIVR